jgi:hypothetical protein
MNQRPDSLMMEMGPLDFAAPHNGVARLKVSHNSVPRCTLVVFHSPSTATSPLSGAVGVRYPAIDP